MWVPANGATQVPTRLSPIYSAKMPSSDHISCSLMVLAGAAFRMKDNYDTLPILTRPDLGNRFRNLPVVDVGANDGIFHSNSYYPIRSQDFAAFLKFG